MNTVIKSGTREFHGGAYYFLRNEDLNANEWLNNRNGLPRPRYRFNNPGYFIGGPVVLPGTNLNNKQTNTNYGYFSGAALARRLVIGLKFYFDCTASSAILAGPSSFAVRNRTS